MRAPFNREIQNTRYVSLGIVLHFFLYTSLSSTSHGITDRFLRTNYEIVAPIKRKQCVEQMSYCGLVNTNSVTRRPLFTELVISTRVGTLIVATIYLQLIQNRYMFRSFTVLQCSNQHCVQLVASDVEVVGYL